MRPLTLYSACCCCFLAQDFVESAISSRQPACWPGRGSVYSLLPQAEAGSGPLTVFDNTGRFAKLWGRVMVVVALYYFLSVPYQIAFLRRSLTTSHRACLLVSYAFDALLVADVLIKFNMVPSRQAVLRGQIPSSLSAGLASEWA